jgi:hypothetical protein
VSGTSEHPSRLYVISPEPTERERLAIVEALERVADEDDAQSGWATLARREAVDDGLS